LYTSQIEDLVSHGYVVIGLDSPYDAMAVLYPDGRIAHFEPERQPPFTLDGEHLNEAYTRFVAGLVEVSVADAQFVLDKLSEPNPDNVLAGHLDFTRIGAVGHSYGGIKSSAMCAGDRFKACINLDGHASSAPFLTERAPKQPFM